MIEVKDLSKSYLSKKNRVDVLKNVSFCINQGEVVGLLGSNGAGKTTLIKSLCGLIEPDAGQVTIRNLAVNHQDKRALKYISSVLEGNRNLYWRLTVKENIEYFLGNRGISRKSISIEMDNLLKKFSLLEKKNELVKNLSRGMQQKVAIIIALMSQTEVLLLDEPTLGLDVEANNEIRNFLKEIVKTEKKTILISSHDMNLIERLCDRVIIINKGEVVTDDSVENLLRLFQAISYQFIVDRPLKEEQNEKLRQRYPTMRSGLIEGNHTLEFTILEKKDFYQIVEMLKGFNVFIESIDKHQINFEQVFLTLVKGERQYATI
ncbi:ABC transporter ATP-binding protein [Bacillus sp. 349Y]|nr:ABC transporter ATP-binding protein [Bacillus sp. 349Y]